ncbi:MAG: hypothetical protein A3J83_01950 [Elusimicrobia bacterium RIFOXYA2_FULL_40_6]|nr:MAG: hypothetical protein A3J83_01950 [Elusimicrobia bacterium RIFOXYA2_FULL_40_6]
MESAKIREFIERMSAQQQRMSEGFKFKLSGDLLKNNLGIAHLMVMKLLTTAEKAPIITDLVKKLSISAPMMTHIIDKLESTGLVKRVRNEDDRRIVRIEPTQKGRNIILKFDEEHKKRMLEFLNQLDEKEQNEFINSINTLMSIMMKYQTRNSNKEHKS